MKRFFRFSAFILLIAMGLVAILLTAGYVFEDDIKRAVINELNKNLNAEVILNEKDIRLDLLRGFPNASLEFNSLRIRESIADTDYYLAELDKLSLYFNPFDLVRKIYTIRSVSLHEGYIQLRTLKNGDVNYQLWKSKSTGQESAELSILLDKIELDQIEFRYSDEKNGLYFEEFIRNGSGNFKSEGEKLQVKASLALDSKSNRIRDIHFLEGQDLDIETEFSYESSRKKLSFKHLDLKLGSGLISTRGSLNLGPNTSVDFRARSDRSDLAQVMASLPGNLFPGVSSFRSSGQLKFDASVKGPVSRGMLPEVSLTCSIDNGSLSNRDYRVKLEKIKFGGEFQYRPQNLSSSFLKLTDFYAEESGNPVNLDLEWSDFTDPRLAFDLNGRFALGTLFLFIPDPAIRDPKGEIVIENISLNGKMSEFKKASGIAAHLGQGKVGFIDVSFQGPMEKVKSLNGSLEMEGNKLKIEELSIVTESSDLLLNGTISNLIPHLFSTNSAPKSKILVDATLVSEKLDIVRIMPPATDTEPSEQKMTGSPGALSDVENQPQRKELLSRVRGDLELNIEELIYNKVKIEKVKGRASLSSGLLEIDELRGQTMDGNVNLTAYFREMPSGIKVLEMQGLLSSIRIEQLFGQFDNFGQNTLESRHLRGALSTEVKQLTLVWSPSLDFLPEKLFLDADVLIESGELIAFEPLESLSKFIDLNELKHIRFSRLENHVNIEDGLIILPLMKIRSSALDLEITGTHSFRNEIDYLIKLSMADILASKMRKNKRSGIAGLDEFEDNEEGGMNIYVSMKGPSSDPMIALNKKDIKKRFKEIVETEAGDPSAVNSLHSGEKGKPGLIDWDEDVEGELEFIDWESEDKKE